MGGNQRHRFLLASPPEATKTDGDILFKFQDFCVARVVALVFLIGAIFFAADARAAGQFSDYLAKAQPAELIPGADRFGPLQGDPAIAPVYKNNQLLGFAYLNSDFSNSVGYSGKPIKLLVGISPQGVLTGFKLVEHKEPIVLIGIPEKRILEAINKLIGTEMVPVVSGAARAPQVDIVSGATVTVLVIGDSIVRSATKLIKTGRLGTQGQAGAAAVAAPVVKTIDMSKSETRDWQTLLGDGSIRRLHLNVADINEAYEKSGNAAAVAQAEAGDPGDDFIDLYVADVAVPTIGRSLLGDDGYDRLKARLKPGQQALVVAGSGRYSFKGSGYVRGGIFDRIELLQDSNSIRFRDRDHTRLGDFAAAGAPSFPEISLFVLPPDFAFDPAQPWTLQLLVQRAIGAREKAFLTFDLGYTLPDTYLKREQPAAVVRTEPSVASPQPSQGAAATPSDEEPLWMRIWRGDVVRIGITIFALGTLTVIFFFQNVLVRRPKVYVWVRRAYLLFVLVWLGWYVNAQLSVVNVLTFMNSLLTGFSWEYFLSAPHIFLLWASVAAGLLFWGRGPFCGWLCPFGALQELLSAVAQALKVPQVRLPWGLHERTLADQIHDLPRPVRPLALLHGAGRADRGDRAVQDRDHPEIRARLAVRHLRADPAHGRVVHRAFLLPLFMSARRRARHSRARSHVRVAAPLAGVRFALSTLRRRMSGAGDSSRRTYQRQ